MTWLLIDRSSYGFTSTRQKNRSFGNVLPSHFLGV